MSILPARAIWLLQGTTYCPTFLAPAGLFLDGGAVCAMGWKKPCHVKMNHRAASSCAQLFHTFRKRQCHRTEGGSQVSHTFIFNSNSDTLTQNTATCLHPFFQSTVTISNDPQGQSTFACHMHVFQSKSIHMRVIMNEFGSVA